MLSPTASCRPSSPSFWPSPGCTASSPDACAGWRAAIRSRRRAPPRSSSVSLPPSPCWRSRSRSEHADPLTRAPAASPATPTCAGRRESCPCACSPSAPSRSSRPGNDDVSAALPREMRHLLSKTHYFRIALKSLFVRIPAARPCRWRLRSPAGSRTRTRGSMGPLRSIIVSYSRILSTDILADRYLCG